nr:signal peptidase I [uncultured Sellimonas sp.]
MKRIRKVLKWFERILILYLFAYALFFCIPSFWGITSAGVLSGSMEPDIQTGDLVYLKDAGAEKLKPGDVIAFEIQKENLILHRIKKICPDGKIITQGDANETEDFYPIERNQVKGIPVFCIPHGAELYDLIKDFHVTAWILGYFVFRIFIGFIRKEIR